VNIILGMGWNIKVDDNINGRQIKTTISRVTLIDAQRWNQNQEQTG
jgi:hypothetical protein